MLNPSARLLTLRRHHDGLGPDADTVEARIGRTKAAGWPGPWRLDGRPVTHRAQLEVMRAVHLGRIGAPGWDQSSVAADLATLESRLAGALPGDEFHIHAPGELPVPTKEKAA